MVMRGRFIASPSLMSLHGRRRGRASPSMCSCYQADVFLHHRAVSRSVPAAPIFTRRSLNISHDEVSAELPRRLNYHAVWIDDSGCPVGHQALGMAGDICTDNVNAVLYCPGDVT